jgi:hypothetical protein
MTGVDVLDRVTLVTPLGLRFVDDLTGTTIADGLAVSYEGSAGPERAIVNRVGVHLVSGLPGLRAAEQGAGDAAYWAAPPATGTVTVVVEDALGRFLAFRLEADVPFRGPFFAACDSPLSPPGDHGSVPLFSAPSRTVPAGLAALRLELWDVQASPLTPAAWAYVDVSVPGGERLGRGIADGQGRVLVCFPYPPLPAAAGGPRALSAQTWPLQLRVRYSRLPESPSVPHDLCDLLAQAPATLLDRVSPPSPLPDQLLAYGRELTAVTHGHNIVLVATP